MKVFMLERRTYKIQADAYKIQADVPKTDMFVTVTWAELAAVNEPETMDAIALLGVGEMTVLGMCDWIERAS